MMNSYFAIDLAKTIQNDLDILCVSRLNNKEQHYDDVSLYDSVVSDEELRKMTSKLFYDGHYARAVEEAFKFLDNLVKKRSKVENSGQRLMRNVFSSNSPKLKLNSGISISERDEQSGYMDIMAGCMTGIRNPRAHESDWEDTEYRAIQLLSLADHLVGRVRKAEIVK